MNFGWDIGRLLVSQHISVKYTDLTNMSCDDVTQLNEFLDVYEPAFADANRRPVPQ